MIVNPIFSMIFNQVYTIGFYVPLEPLNYWFIWLNEYGWFTIILAIIGVYLIRIGYLYIKEYDKDESIEEL